jgi:hypothetical protein
MAHFTYPIGKKKFQLTPLVFAGLQNFKLKWKGPYQRSDGESRYPENMKEDTAR